MGQWVKGKSHDTYGPTGPYLVTKDEIKDVNNLKMKIELGDIDVSYDVRGNGEPVVLVHGLAENKESWNGIKEKLGSVAVGALTTTVFPTEHPVLSITTAV